MSKIKGTELVEKRNILNEVRRTSMTLQELRFFSIYLAKINARDINTKRVRFKLSDFQKIMEFNQINIVQLKKSTNSLLSKVVNVPDGKDGYTGFTLFKRCKVFKENFDWYIEIEASDDALPLMFDFKSHYFTYELWNALQLKSANQIRMYELLKQYEYIGKREISVLELRELLGIASNEYPRWERFRTKVLDSCQKALAENTDICFTYEKGKSGGRGGKWLTIIFHITKTKQRYFDEDDDEEESNWQNPHMNLYRSSCDYEFSVDETALLVLTIDANYLPDNEFGVPFAKAQYLQRKYLEMKYEAKQKTIKSRFKYLKKMIEEDFKEEQQ